jgi:transcriptional regulator with XRE-family HTH domain
VTTKRDRVLSDFIDAWNTGQRPDVDAFLARVDEPERSVLADEIATFVTWSPDPDYDDAALDAIAAEPIVQEVVASLRQPSGLWPALLPRLRRRASLTTQQLAQRLTVALGLPTGSETKTERYLDHLEAGELDPTRLSRRLIDGLGGALGVSSGLLTDATARFSMPAPAPLFRAEAVAAADTQDDLDLLADALTTPATADWDEVDALFRGG